MEYGVEKIIQSVKIALDENKVSKALIEEDDVDTLTLDEIIESKIVDAVKTITLDAPNYLLEGGIPFGESIGWQSRVGYGAGQIFLPEDFLRLVCFQMSDWSYAITEPISADHQSYKMQFSRIAGVKGNPQKPVVAIVSQAGGRVLQFFSCSAGDSVYIKQALYIPTPSIIDGVIEIGQRLYSSVIYYIAHLVLLSLKEVDAATIMLNISKELLR
jgi:hypothetical protein